MNHPEEIPNFASDDAAQRRRWAETIIQLHLAALDTTATTRDRLAGLGIGKRQLGHYADRIAALTNSLNSWTTYRREGYPRRPGAPAIRPISKYV